MSKSGCQGFCQMGPLVTIEPDGILYTKVKPSDVDEIVDSTLLENRVVERLLYVDPTTGEHCRGAGRDPLLQRQAARSVLKHAGGSIRRTSASTSITAVTGGPASASAT